MASISGPKQFVKDFEDRQAVNSVFMVSEKAVLNDRNGKSYISLNLRDSSGMINARIWENAEELTRLFESGDFILVRGHVQTYQNRKQVIIHGIERADKDKIHLKDFVLSHVPDPEVMWNKLIVEIKSVADPHIRGLLEHTFEDSQVKGDLLRAPAAKTIHHAYMGGLLEHILSITQIMKFLADHYSFLNRDLLIFGAIYHDLGKIGELAFESGIKYTDRGRLVGHMAIACEMIDKYSQKVSDFPEKLKDILKHIVLSHHGKIEYGSPKLPQLIEAVVVSMVDDIDSKLNAIHQFMSAEISSDEPWSRLSPQFDRYFYLDFYRARVSASAKAGVVDQVPPREE